MVSLASQAVVHALLFYLVWYVVVLLMSEGTYEAFALMAQVGFVALFAMKRELKFIVIVSIMGLAFDSIPVYLGLLEFPNTDLYVGVYPLWMTLMWSIFATSFYTSLAWLHGKVLYQVIFGAIGGPLSLYAGSLIGALNFPKGQTLPLILCSVEWATTMPLLFFMHRRLSP
jgi:hypothetical protein